MIKIIRGKCPPLLASGDTLDNKKCHDEVVGTLHKRQYGKCCYCEKEISTSGNEQAIEHYKPKAPNKFPELENTWENLLHACADCNGKKGQQFPVDENDDPLIIDPSSENSDPEDHLKFHVDDNEITTFGGVSPRKDSNFDDTTIRILGLDLVTRRRDRARYHTKLLEKFIEIYFEQDEITKQQKIRMFEMTLSANNKYAAFAREFARFKKMDSSDYGVRIPRGAQILQ